MTDCVIPRCSMKSDLEETQLKQLFADLRQQDERTTPSFGATWHSAMARSEAVRPSLAWFRLSTLTAVLIGVAVAVSVFLPRSRTEPRQAQPVSLTISQWQSPTDFLLTTPGEQLLKTVPQLDVTWLG